MLENVDEFLEAINESVFYDFFNNEREINISVPINFNINIKKTKTEKWILTVKETYSKQNQKFINNTLEMLNKLSEITGYKLIKSSGYTRGNFTYLTFDYEGDFEDISDIIEREFSFIKDIKNDKSIPMSIGNKNFVFKGCE